MGSDYESSEGEREDRMNDLAVAQKNEESSDNESNFRLNEGS